MGDYENATEVQKWAAMLANLLITLMRKRIKLNRAFSNLISIIRQ